MKAAIKSLRSTLILLLLALAGGAFLWWNERGQAPSPGALVLLRAPKNEIRRVVFRPNNFVLERDKDGAWTVRDPKTNRAALIDEEQRRQFWAQIELV